MFLKEHKVQFSMYRFVPCWRNPIRAEGLAKSVG
jgi:hypothetical protein